jgi:hypothetical protein
MKRSSTIFRKIFKTEPNLPSNNKNVKDGLQLFNNELNFNIINNHNCIRKIRFCKGDNCLDDLDNMFFFPESSSKIAKRVSFSNQETLLNQLNRIVTKQDQDEVIISRKTFPGRKSSSIQKSSFINITSKLFPIISNPNSTIVLPLNCKKNLI